MMPAQEPIAWMYTWPDSLPQVYLQRLSRPSTMLTPTRRTETPLYAAPQRAVPQEQALAHDVAPLLLKSAEALASCQQELAAAREALAGLLKLCENANDHAFDNGVTDNSGKDEGDYWASTFMDAARAALTANSGDALVPDA